VQDWFWWKDGGKGDPVYNSGYTDVPAELKTLHDEHIHAMISAWALMDCDQRELQADGPERLRDRCHAGLRPHQSRRRDFFWNQFVGKLFAQGWDAFWLDSSEPEEAWPHLGDAVLRDKQLHIGSGLEYTNVFPLAHTAAWQAHWKQATNPDKRVFLLTRSAFMGQQRVGAAVWSGDVYSSWWALRRQVPAGLNFALSGYPYWTTDIGGYHPLNYAQTIPPGYQELYARWFEYGAFCPVFRTHGHRDRNELWVYDQVFPALLAIDRLRYRLLPYVYSLAWKVTERGLHHSAPAGDGFPRGSGDLGDRRPVHVRARPSGEPGAHRARHFQRSLYLPAGTRWYDFWTGSALGRVNDHVAGSARPHSSRCPRGIDPAPRPGDRIRGPGHRSNRAARLSRRRWRLHALRRRGRQLPIRERRSRHHPDPLGRCHAHSHDRRRQGSYPGMPPEHTFNVVIVSSGHGVGPDATSLLTRSITPVPRLEAKF
jgi:alpha-D-xyloside xylohydrolase